MEEDDAVGRGFRGEELEADGAVARRAGLKPRPYNRQRREQRCKPSGDKTYHYFRIMLGSVDQKPHSLKAVPMGRDGEVNSPLQRTRRGGSANAMTKIVKKALSDARLSAKQKRRLKKLAERPDSEIDFSDIPELTEKFWRNAVRNSFYRR